MLGLVCLQTQFIAFLFVLDWNFRFQMVLAHAINRYGEPVVGQKTRCFGHQRTSIGNVPCNVWFFNENRSLKLFIKHHPPATNHLISIERLWSKIWPIFWPKVVFHRPMNALVYQTEVLPQNVFNFICIFLQIMIRAISSILFKLVLQAFLSASQTTNSTFIAFVLEHLI